MAKGEKTVELELTESQLLVIRKALEMAQKGSKKKQAELFGGEELLEAVAQVTRKVDAGLVSLQPLELFWAAISGSRYYGNKAVSAYWELRPRFCCYIAAGGFTFDVYEFAGLMVAIVPNAKAYSKWHLHRPKNGQWQHYNSWDNGRGSRDSHLPPKLEDVYDHLRLEILPELEKVAPEERRYWLHKLVSAWTEKCSICGRKLTDLVSIERGIGPECWSQYGTEKEEGEPNVDSRDERKEI